jgi:hypothetical protein
MRHQFWHKVALSTLSTATLLAYVPARAQECQNYNATDMSCHSGNEQCVISLETPFGNGYNVLLPINLYCCTTPVHTYYVAGQCDAALLRPGVQSQLAKLAATTPLLVAKCAGDYLPFTGEIRPGWVRNRTLRLESIDALTGNTQ